MRLRIRPFNATEATEASTWAYEPPFDIYNAEAVDSELYLAVSPEGFGYYAVIDTGIDPEQLVGFCCFGPEARVVGQSQAQGMVDVGGGVRPDLVSQGVATQFFPLVREFAQARFGACALRTAVASFNERSRRLCLAAGFDVVRTFEGPGGREFQELVRRERRS